MSCKGDIKLDNIMLRGGLLSDTLYTEKSKVKCYNQKINIRNSGLNYGYWSISNSLEVLLNENNINSSASIKIKDFDHKPLSIKAKLPISIVDRSLVFGDLDSNFNLESFPLGALNPILDSNLGGKLDAKGYIKGPLSSLNSRIDIALENPETNGIRLREKWKGTFSKVPDKNEWGSLEMKSDGASIPGKLKLNFTQDGNFNDLIIDRL